MLFKNESKRAVKRVGAFFKKHSAYIICIVFMTAMLTENVSAADAEGLWTTISELIGTWVTRLGAVVMFVGGIMFGLGWKNDDAEGKSRGVSTLIAGAIVTAVAALTGTFFA